MSRIRVYELAKEAGMSSKVLADKLLEHGYDIKGHSSTVDDETAEKIRKTILKSTDTELVEKRISESGKSTVIRRRATVIRRRPKAEPKVEEPVVEKEKEAVPESPAQLDSTSGKDLETAAETKEAVVESEVTPPEKKTVPEEVSGEKQGEPEPVPGKKTAESKELIEEEKGVLEEKDSEIDTPQPQEPERKEAEETVSDKKTPAVKNKVEKKQPIRKNVARVVGTIELPKEETQPSRPRKKGGKPASQRRARPTPAAMAPVADRDDGSRGRKKGKKGAHDGKSDDYRSRGGKKGKKGLKFTHFANDYQARGGKRGRKGGRKAPKPVAPPSEMKASKKRFKVYDSISVGDLAQRMKVKASDVIAKLMGLGSWRPSTSPWMWKPQSSWRLISDMILSRVLLKKSGSRC
ncbi:hypothetical protein DGMP_19180 [Desulfomarina profundi]|uniref:Translation initiation factor IF-2 N-terminal domain-containing protein n=1 Tax=Desulfomarina profundi TaxID=2772557 RepID=A0A8D5FIA5_9BACT|nr:translation initiation factor IF-2 N-terminal domain-containing protein [Desulfomarina profundi]BCL61225.1 hypothetical protein DGMP_19180 [Desulfomarina profundi]